jgi:hypothetical protein
MMYSEYNNTPSTTRFMVTNELLEHSHIVCSITKVTTPKCNTDLSWTAIKAIVKAN